MKLSTWFSVLKIARHLGKASAKLRRRVEHLFRDRLRRLATKRANRRRVHLGLGLAAGVWPLEERVLLSTATWVGGAGTLNWGDQANWSDDVLPTSTDEVVIGDLGDNQSIVVNMPVTIGSLNSAEGINVLGGQSLTITGAMSSAVTGPFTLASGATLSANSGASFNATGVTNIDGASLYASGGATISLPQLSSYLSTGNSIFQASGAGTSIYFPALSQLSNHSNDHERLNIQALEGGLIDLANLISITDPGAGSTSCRSVNIGADGVNSQIDLSSLMSFQDVDGSTWDWSYPGYSSLSASNGGLLTLGKAGASLTFANVNISRVVNSFILMAGGAQAGPEFGPGRIVLQGAGSIAGDPLVSAATLALASGADWTIGTSLDLSGTAALQVDVAGMLRLSGSLTGGTTNQVDFTPAGKMLFGGSPVQQLEAMGQDLGISSAGYDANFAYERLELANNTTVQLVDEARNKSGTGAEAVYVKNLVVPEGTTLDLNGLNLYIQNGTIDGTVINGMVNQVPATSTTTTRVSTSTQSSEFGQEVLFTATVLAKEPGVGTPDGWVIFQVDDLNFGDAVHLVNGEASLATSALAVGAHSMSAKYYPSTSYFAESQASPISQTVTPATTTTALTSSANSSTYGTSVTFTATVTAGATGTVTFKEGSEFLGTGTISGGLATFSTSGLTAGNHTITAVYGGDGNYAGSTSSAVTQTVTSNIQATTTTLSLSATNVVYGQTDTFTATVSAATGTPTGSVQFLVDGVNYGSPVSLVSGLASLSLSGLDLGTHTIYAIYGGDGLFFTPSADAHSWISTVAGNGSFSVSGDGDAATRAGLGFPTCVAVDSSGNLYISDDYHHRVREVVKSTGIIITVAGNGSKGFSGDEAVATNAMLNTPGGVAVDNDGNLYIADGLNFRIREVVKATGQIITVAGNGTQGFSGDGGPATDAALNNYSGGLAVDSVGNVFFADSLNFRIREIVKATGTIITVAGNGGYGSSGDGGAATAAPIGTPQGLAIDNAGNLYIGDTYNHVVREVFRATGTIMTIAGNGTSGFSSDGDAATKAALGYPRYLAVDLNGNLFIGDDLNSVVREVVKSTGKIITVAGNKSYGFSGDGGAATEARLAYPRGLTVDSLGNLFIADSYNGRIRQVSPGLRLNVSPAATTLSLAWDGSTEYGQGRTITAVVQPVSPSTEILMTGSVQFLVDGVNYGGPVLLSGNKAELQDASLTAATHVITAVYTGDTNYTGSTAPAFIAEVHQAATNTSLTVSDDPSTYGNLVTFHADVTGGSLYLDVPGPSGSVTYYDGETILGTDWTSSSQEASFSTSVLGAGLHHFRAVYAGNSNYEGSSGSYDLTVNKASSATALSSSANPSTFGTSVTFTATVTAGVTGTVTFKEGSTVLGTGTISGGLATFITSGLTAGSHTITAEYAGDANYAGSTSGAVAQTVNQASSSTTLSSTANPSTYGTSVTFTATVTGSAGTPTGPVQFVVDGSNYGSPVTLVNGSAILAVSNLSTGKRGITAVYAGDGQNYAGSTASPLTQVVTASHQGTITTLSISGSSVVFGQAVTLIATVSASSGTPTGLVRFQLDGLDIGDPVALVDGTAQVQISSAAVGRHSVTARYLGTADLYAASTGVVNGLDTYIETIAGTGVGGYNGDGMAATNTTLFYPQSVAFDAEGNIFIADQVNHRIRQILKATGEVITVVGNGNAGYNGDNIPASDATLFYPSAVAIDQEGNLLIADQFNHRIREVVKATGLIKTVAGNGNAGYNGDGMAATDASLNQPLGFAIDSSGNLFFGDRYNHRVREVVKATGIIQTVAGTGVPGFSGNGMMATNAQVSEPLGVSVDSDGNIFFADFANHRIREIVEATGEIITVAGNGYAVYNGDGIAATEAGLFYPVNVTVNSHGNIYIADTYNNRIREVVKSTGLIGTVAGDGEPGFGGDGGLATSARLYLPEGVTFDDLGNLYISDLFNHAIRKLTSPGLIVSAASTTTVISTSDPQINAGELVTFTATVSASVGTPTGTVQFQIDGVNYGSPVSLTQGVASLVTSTLAAGIHSITAAYSSDTANYQDSLSDPISQTVNQGPVVTTQPIDAMIHPGEIATFTAAASGFPAPSVQWQVKTDGGNSGDFLGVDTSTQGNWKGVYGSEGYNTFEASSYPAYMSVNIGTNARYIYATGQTTDPRALQVAASGSTDRISAVWYTNDTMTTEVTFTDGASHRVAFYVMDADHRGRAERIDVIDRSTGEILDTRTVDQFDSGQYLSWNVKGSVGFKFTNLPGSLNAVFSGLFIDSNGQWQDIPGATTPTIRTDGTNLIRSIPLVNADFEAAPILGPGQTPVPVGAGKLIFTAPGSNADWYNQQISGIQGWLNATPNNGGVSSDSGLSRGDSLFGRDPQGQIAFINNWDRMMSQTVANQASAGDVLTASIESGTLGSDTDGGRAGTFYLVAGEANPENLDQFSSRSIVLAKLTVANHSWTHTQADVRVGNRVYVPLTLSYTYATNDPALGLPLTIAFRTELGSVGPTYWDNAALSVKTKLNGNQFRAVFTNELGTAISNPASLTIGAGSTATVLAGSTATSVYGQPVTFTATVTGNSGTPTGVVQFIVDGQNLGSPVSLNAAGTASLNLASLSVGTHTISASYSGDGQNYLGSASQAFTEQVTAAPTSTLLAGATTSAVYGQSVTFTATVSANAPSTAVATGSVQFLLDGVNYGDAVSLVAGVASLSLSSLAVGSHTVSASYTSSDSSFLNSSGVCVGTAGIIKTVAGTGNYGTSGDGGPATGAELTYVEGVATDADGNLYVADTQNHVIREVIKATGVIITVAGTGVADYTGDGGQATAATLFNPEGIVVDAAGNLFIADSGNNVIREVIRATGVIITVAGTGVADYTGDGGQATDATLDGAVGVAVDGAGNLFIADTYNNVIREVIAATSKIITVAGTGFSGYTGDGGAATDATLFHPLGLAMDGVGNVFIADMGNSVIRKVDQSTGMITTVAGNGYSGLAGDGGLATQAQLGNPNGVAVDGSGNLYISDSNNHVVRLVNAQTGFISTIVGTGSSGYSGDGAAASNATLHYPTDVALDTLGNLFISDTYNNVVREVSSSSIVVTGAATTTTVSSLAPSIVYGQSSTLRATVAAVAPSTSVPTGQVQFQVDGVNVGSPVDLVNGVASFELTQLNAGTHTVSASYLGDGVNMLGSSSSNVTQLVTRAALTIQAGDQSKTYGDTLDLGNSGFTATGLQYGETVGLVTLTSAGSTATVGVGTYAITPNAASGGTFNAGNYAITYQTGTLTVNKAHLTVSADAVSKTYDGQAFTGFTATISGFVNGETVGVLSGTASFSGAATTAVNAGSYAITVSQGTLTATNYDFTAFKAGTLTITKATATVVVTPYNVTYDGLSHTATVTSIAGVNGETGATVGTVTPVSYTHLTLPTIYSV